MQKKKYQYIQIGIASSEEIRSWSYGEVTNHETINYRSHKPTENGLFCEKIFGPQRDNVCACGKTTRAVIRKNAHGDDVRVCERCGVEITSRNVRRERMGHINLAIPVVHTWFLNNTPCKISVLLDSEKFPAADIKAVVNYNEYVIIDTGNIEELYNEQLNAFKEEHSDLDEEDLLNLPDYPKDPAVTHGKFVSAAKLQKWQALYGRDCVKAETGAEAIRILLKELDLQATLNELRAALKTAPKAKINNIVKRLELVEAFLQSSNKPEWMVMDVIPVVPPQIRPMVPLDGGRYATTDLNDLYRNVINRNKNLKDNMNHGFPIQVLNNSKRLLQKAVDALFDNSKQNKNSKDKKNVRKSLSDNLKGKQGRLRQNLLGKRVDYSGRSVIVIGPDLKMYQCGIPREMAMILYKPFIINSIIQHEHSESTPDSPFVSVKVAKEWIEENNAIAQKHLEKVVVEHPVLLNRAPTLHRLGIQAFEPKLIEGKAIRLHPLACPAFNADFDGDQMAVHLPISEEAQAEARLLMLASKNILAPKDGKPISTPSQDMVLGNYYLTIEDPLDPRNGRIFRDRDEIEMAYENNQISLHTRFLIPARALKDSKFETKAPNGELPQIDKYLITTFGKMIFNTVFPSADDLKNNFPAEEQNRLRLIPFVVEANSSNIRTKTPDRFFISPSDFPMSKDKYDFLEHDIDFRHEDGTPDYDKDLMEYVRLLPAPHPFKKGFLKTVTSEVFRKYQISETSRTLDKIKDLGFHYSTKAGITVSYSDFRLMKDNPKIIDSEFRYRTDLIASLYKRGASNKKQKDDQAIARWTEATKDQMVLLSKDQELNSSTNDIYLMGDSGARGDTSNFRQISGVLGIVRSAKEGNLAIPVLSGFQKGLTMTEFFMSTHGARKTSTDTALKTAESGYLTRRLVDVSQDVIIRENDCGTENGVWVEDLYRFGFAKEDKNKIENVADRINGRYTCGTLTSPSTGEVILGANEFIDEQAQELILGMGVKRVKIRSILTCDCKRGVCVKCYGSDMTTNETVEKGEAVGIIAAQSIGEPGTQLTLRTFHSGSVAGSADITAGLPRVQELIEARSTVKGLTPISEIKGKVTKIEAKEGKSEVIEVTIQNPITGETCQYSLDAGKKTIVHVGDEVKAGTPLSEGAIDPKALLRVADARTAQDYIISEVENVYKKQNDVSIADKHLEIIVRQMFQKVIIDDSGDTNLLPGSPVSRRELLDAVKDCLENGKRCPTAHPIILGITKASLKSDSFLSAASFQETTRILTEAAIRSKKDTLEGLKENVILGNLIPAGTGLIDADWEETSGDEPSYEAPELISYKYNGFEEALKASSPQNRPNDFKTNSLPSSDDDNVETEDGSDINEFGAIEGDESSSAFNNLFAALNGRK